ncbi:MAG: GNAT family N-acetyltransferase [Actinomycetota bacterium]
MDAFGRIWEFDRWFFEASSTRCERTRFGTAYFNDEFRLRFMANLLFADHVSPATPPEVAGELDKVFDGFGHRRIMLSDTEGERVGAGMHDLGYTPDRTVAMVHRGEPDRAPHPELVEEVDHAHRRTFLKASYLREKWGEAPGVADALSEFSGWLEAKIGARFFVQRIEGEIAGTCELYVHDGMAQVESVDTLPEFRGRGIARNVVMRAVAEGRGAGADTVFIEADAADWPQELYERLGFEHVGAYRGFLKSPNNAPKGDAKK